MGDCFFWLLDSDGPQFALTLLNQSIYCIVLNFVLMSFVGRSVGFLPSVISIYFGFIYGTEITTVATV
jgi:hypothetical protein